MSYPLMLAMPHGTIARDPEAVVSTLHERGGWTFEFKYDGIRALVQLSDGTVRITNRNGRDITFRYPDVVAKLEGMAVDAVLDGEIVCTDATGRPDYHLVHHRDAQQSARGARQLAQVSPAQFVVFDVLAVNGVDLRVLSYLDRHHRLVELAGDLTAHGATVPPTTTDGPAAWQVVIDLNLEGLVAKRNDSRYQGRRSPSWVKIKRTRSVSALVSGYDAGEGSRADTFGALRLSLIDETGRLVDVGSVGSGFTEADVRRVWDRLSRGDHPIIVEVSYLEFSPTGHLRQPVFRGLRTDVDPTACTMAQLR